MKKVLALVLVMMLVATSAWAFNDAKHVKVAPNGKGDLLIFPFYYTANGGWQTKLTVTNTSPTYSVVAKLVVRSHYHSEELLDFLLYLSPNDVWTGTLTNDGTTTYMESTDDSALAPNGTFASATNPMKQALSQATCIPSKQSTLYAPDSRDYGYVEVIEAWYGNVADAYYTVARTGTETVSPPVSKTYLRRLYDSYAVAGTVYLPGRPQINTAGLQVVPNLDRTINVLAGHFEFQNALVSGYSSLEQAAVFADWDNVALLKTTEGTALNGTSRNTSGELEAALAKQDLALPYVNQGSDFTVHILNFPTKRSTWSLDSLNYCRYFEGGGGPFWDDPAVPVPNTWATDEYKCPRYQPLNYDLSENGSQGGVYSGVGTENKLCEEVNLLLSTTGFGVNQAVQIFTEGWTRYNFYRLAGGANRFPTQFTTLQSTPNINHAYYGAPVIPIVLMGKLNGISVMKGAGSDGHVYGEPLVAGVTADPNSTFPGASFATGWYNRVPARLDVANYPNTPVAGYVTAIANPYVVGGATAIASWLPEYQYSNEIIELGIETLYP